MSEVVLAALERELTPQEWHRRFARRPPTNLNVSAADMLAQERRVREGQLG